MSNKKVDKDIEIPEGWQEIGRRTETKISDGIVQCVKKFADKTTVTYECEYCDDEFWTAQYVAEHILEKHPEFKHSIDRKFLEKKKDVTLSQEHRFGAHVCCGERWSKKRLKAHRFEKHSY